MIKDIAHICLASTDLAASLRFYCDVLGFKKQFDFVRDNAVFGHYLEVTQGRYIEIFHREVAQASDRHPILHFCLEVDDIDTVKNHLAKHNIETTDKKLGPDHNYQTWAIDPDGVRIEFHQYTPQSCQRTGEPCVVS